MRFRQVLAIALSIAVILPIVAIAAHAQDLNDSNLDQTDNSGEEAVQGQSETLNQDTFDASLSTTAADAGVADPAPKQLDPKAATQIKFDEPNLSSGSYNLSIPVNLPPGIAGFAPSISLNYNSDTHDGIAGFGWSIVTSAGGCIERKGPPITTVDGHTIYGRGLLTYSDQDTLYLNGERLVRCDDFPSTSCPSGSLRSEHDNLVKIEIGTGEDSLGFLATSPDGTVTHYGKWSKVNWVGANNFFPYYCPTRIVKDGKLIRVDYATAGAEAPTVQDIWYGGPEGGTSQWQVHFDYEIRPDTRIIFQTGYTQNLNTRLKKITVTSKTGLQYSSLKLIFEQAPGTLPVSGVSRLKSVQECGTTDSVCMPAHQFTYADATSAAWGSANNIPSLNSQNEFTNNGDWSTLPENSQGIMTVDLDHDGFTDLLKHRMHDGTDDTDVWINNRHGGFSHDSATTQLWQNRLSQSSAPYFTIEVPYGASPTDVDNGVRFIDVNGDGFEDIVQGMYDPINPVVGNSYYVGIWNPSTNLWDTWLGSGFRSALQSNQITFTLFLGSNATNSSPYIDLGSGTVPADVNGDGLTDIIISREPITTGPAYMRRHEVWLNDGHTFQLSGIIPPMTISKGNTGPIGVKGAYPQGVEVIDINGDGLPDFVQDQLVYYHQAGYSQQFIDVYFNTGYGWQPDGGSYLTSLQNISDFKISEVREKLVWDAAGNSAVSWQPISIGTTMADVNGDGLVDLVRAYCVDTSGSSDAHPSYPGDCSMTRTYLNTGSGFTTNQTAWRLPAGAELTFSTYSNITDFSGRTFDSGLKFLDLDNDGRVDILRNRTLLGSGGPGTQRDMITSAARFDKNLLIEVRSPFGAVTDVTYGTVSSADSSNEIPFAKTVTKSITMSNGRGSLGGRAESTKNFYYFGGKFDPKEKRFLGFQAVSVSDPGGSWSTTTFHNQATDRCRAGAISGTAISARPFTDDGAGHPVAPFIFDTNSFEMATTTSHASDFGISHQTTSSYQSCQSNLRYPYLSQPDSTSELEFSADLVKSISTNFTYDSWGLQNTSSTYEDSQLKGSSVTSYTNPNITSWIVGLPCRVRQMDANGQVAQVTFTYYDDSTSLCAQPTRGLPTKVRTQGFGAGQNLTLEKSTSYTALGNVQSVYDSRGLLSSVDWNSTLPEIAPFTSTQYIDASHPLTTTYHFSPLAELKQTDLPNGTSQFTEFNDLHLPYISYITGQGGVKSSYTYTEYEFTNSADTQNIRTFKLLDGTAPTDAPDLNSGTWVIDYSIFDGFGREMLKITSNKYIADLFADASPDDYPGMIRIAQSTLYNDQGKVAIQTIPYDGNTYSLAHIRNETSYDSLGRVTSVLAPGGYLSQMDYFLINVQGQILNAVDSRSYYTDRSSTPSRYKVARKTLLSDGMGKLRRVIEFNSTQCDEGAEDLYCGLDGVLSSNDSGIYSTIYEYDARGNRSKACRAGSGNSCSSPGAVVTRWFYDGLNRLIAEKDPNLSQCVDNNPDDINSGCPSRTSYDAFGNVSRITDPMFAVDPTHGSATDISYTRSNGSYDLLSRPVTKTASKAGDVSSFTFLYDGERNAACPSGMSQQSSTGQLTSEMVSKNSGQEVVLKCHGHDSFGRLNDSFTSIKTAYRQNPETARFGYTFTSGGLAKDSTTTYNGVSETVTQNYDGLGRPQSLVSNSSGTLVSGVKYNQVGQEKERFLPQPGITLTHTYNDGTNRTLVDQRLRNINAWRNGSSGSLISYQFDYDELGNIRGFYDWTQTKIDQYEYDNLSRLTSFTENGNTVETFGYDARGNQTSHTRVAPTQTPPPGGGGRKPPADIQSAR